MLICASGVTDETDVAETCTDVDWISLVACASGVTGETIVGGTSSGVDGKHVLLALWVLLWKMLMLGPALKLVGPHVLLGPQMLLAPGLFRNVVFWRFVLNQMMERKNLCHRVVTNHKNFP